ncbi:MAG: hypothetical protein A2W25_12625 [candidate division Zixibacteria bacterium RBG_16_53_22]|nr:MAG: hypothetical protein A2W25_12625 [candidate division Zixibacteria bacterium RBG_16_53_22]
MNHGPIESVIFDLDGTLIDSADDIIRCLNRAYDSIGISPLEIKRSHIGPPLKDIIQKVTPDIGSDNAERIINGFRKCYDSISHEKTRIKYGFRKTLDQLSSWGIRTFIVTNKPQKPTRMIADKLRLTGFSEILTPDIGFRERNKAEMITDLIAHWNLDSGRTLMVGDTESDVYAARKNGLRAAVVRNGYGCPWKIAVSSPDYVLKTGRDLIYLLSDNFR